MKGRAIGALGLALFVLAVFVWLVGWDEVFAAAATASLPMYALAFVAASVTLVARSVVWHLLLGTVDEPRPYWLVGGVFLTAMFAKYVTPYGQVASGVGVAAIVSRYYESKYEESLAAVLSADFLNYIPYYTLGGVGLAYFLLVDTLPFAISPPIPIAVLVVAAVGLGAATAWHGRDRVRSAIVHVGAVVRGGAAQRFPQLASTLRLENLERRFAGFSATLGTLSNDRRTVVLALGWGHIAWLGLAGALFTSALAVGVRLPVGIAFLCVALSKLGFAMPTPGGVGGVEIALAGALYVVSPMGAATATAVAILYRFATYWFTVFVGGCASIALTLRDPTPP